MIDFDNVFKVFEVTGHIKNILESNIDCLQVEGEVSNYSAPVSGHLYFSLKDEKAIIRCVYFNNSQRKLDFTFKNGDRIIIKGKITVYEREGQYQMIVSKVSPFGKGNLHEKFELLKKKLDSEGLFKSEYKKKIPAYPRNIGIISSETGAALQDMLKVLAHRFPTEVLFYSSLVQGTEAAMTLAEGIRYFSDNQNVDVIIIGRGGGSFEDLFCFNDESLVREIFACKIPVISAVGHETDFTLCDFVADLRAPTPSAAVELATPSRQVLARNLVSFTDHLQSILSAQMISFHQSVSLNESKLKRYHPLNILQNYQQYIDIALLKMQKTFTTIQQSSLTMTQFKKKIDYLSLSIFNQAKQELKKKEAYLKALSPKTILEKGYSMIKKETIITSVKDLQKNDKVTIIFKDGQCFAEIE